ncbi:retropepsin-like aspartic protease family protein [Halomonas getboli]|uniref:retropepsin-like aspartic protease family protein n=1 Tax=Halomonas getboli TaxID=2935862 RepID=UPI001FFEA096|nr:TIGR02281 family clan AA aspartic protease [Halomonas getboli]MCK2183950.1 TIGR02281 family clan AA aspartic protease [Halomonas getboli]
MSERGGGVKRAGLGMMLAFWALLIGLGTWWFQGWFDERENPNANLVESLDGGPLTLARNANGHFVATGRLNGEPVTMLLDTGATQVAVPADLAERLDLPLRGAASFSTANGRVRGHLTILDEVRLGGLVARDVRGSVVPGLEGDTVLLGMSFLGRFELQMRGDTLTLRLPEKDKG